MARRRKREIFRDGPSDILRWKAHQKKDSPSWERVLPEDDDGRTIVNMNVEGMPWYSPESAEQAMHRGSRGGEEGAGAPKTALTREETRFFTWGALKAALLVTGVMCLGIVVFVLFCQWVWFR